MDDITKLKFLMKLREKGIISSKSLLEEIGLTEEAINYKEEEALQDKKEEIEISISKSDKPKKESGQTQKMMNFDNKNNAIICDDVHEFAYQVMSYVMNEETKDIKCKDSLISGYFGFIFNDTISVLINENKITDAPGTIATSSSRIRLCKFFKYAIEKKLDPNKVTEKNDQKGNPPENLNVPGKVIPAWVEAFNVGSVPINEEKPISELPKESSEPIKEKIPLSEEQKLEMLNPSSNNMILLD